MEFVPLSNKASTPAAITDSSRPLRTSNTRAKNHEIESVGFQNTSRGNNRSFGDDLPLVAYVV